MARMDHSVLSSIFFLLRYRPFYLIFLQAGDGGILLNVKMPKMPVAPRSSVSSANLFSVIASQARRFFHLFAVQADDSAFAGSHAENVFQHLGAAGAVKPARPTISYLHWKHRAA